MIKSAAVWVESLDCGDGDDDDQCLERYFNCNRLQITTFWSYSQSKELFC